MPFSFTFGGQPVEVLVKELSALAASPADLLFALNRQKSRILERTARGVDINGEEFHPYNTTRPYYYYPGKLSKSRRAAAGRIARKLGGQRTRVGVKFTSYDAFKRQGLGRSTVDLTGPSAPHMLQAIVVKSSGGVGNARGVIGIYGPEADRAEGHNTGAGHLPRREFFGVSTQDELLIGQDIEDLVFAKTKRLLQ